MTSTTTPELVAYGTLGPADFARIGKDAAKTEFDRIVTKGLTHKENPSLHTRLAMDLDDPTQGMTEIGDVAMNGGGRWAINTRLVGGKLETVDAHSVDSGEQAREDGIAYVSGEDLSTTFTEGDTIDDEDPRNWNGAAMATGRVRINGVLHTKRFGAASSGIEGENDRAVSSNAARAMAAAWELDMKARYELAA